MNSLTQPYSAGITGYSCVTHLGVGAKPLWQACRNNEYSFTQEGLGVIGEPITESCWDWLKVSQDLRGQEKILESSSLLKWSFYSVFEAMKMAGWEKMNDDDGLIVATTTGLIELWEENLLQYFRQQNNNEIYRSVGELTRILQKVLGHGGPSLLVSSACSASTQALGLARVWLKTRKVKRCLVVGAEKLCQLTTSGFSSLSLLGPERCRPFNKSYNGINLSEAAGAICLENKNAPGISGYSSFSDGHSMTAPKPDGSGPQKAMAQALEEAGLNPHDIQWVHAHGTGSLQNDQAESMAISHLRLNCPVSSTKAIHGHSLGASGIIEAILCTKVLQEQQILPCWGGEVGDYEIRLTDTDARLPIHHILKNTLGFGGVNASLVFSQGGH